MIIVILNINTGLSGIKDLLFTKKHHHDHLQLE